MSDEPRARALELFGRAFGGQPAAIASAPGRLEVLGNHADYNLGRVLSCAVPQRTWVAAALAHDGRLEAASAELPGEPRSFALAASAAPGPAGDWSNYLRGLITALRERGLVLPGLRLAVASELPMAAGLSSSAALEVAVLLAVLALLERELPDLELARIGQEAETRAVGARTGLLDQLSSLRGRAGHLLEIDFRRLDLRHHPLPLGLSFVVADSGVKHDLAADYTDRRASCEEVTGALAAREPGLRALGEVDAEAFERHAPSLPGRAARHARHVVGETARVAEALACLGRGDAAGLGRLLLASHRSSRELFENSCPELDRLVELAEADPRCLGARLSGGGFGGVTIHLVASADAEAYAGDLVARAAAALGHRPWTAICPPADGARVETLRGAGR